jgi:RNA polymerase sigma factor (sigma-70 family)
VYVSEAGHGGTGRDAEGIQDVEAPEEFAAFCERTWPGLVRSLDAYIADLAVAEELGQEALLRASQRWPRVRRMESPEGWCHHVAMNLATSYLRRRGSEQRARRRLAAGRHEHHDADTATVLTVRSAVAALPVRERSVITLRFFADLSVRETAQVLNMTEDAVRSLAKRAAQRLRAALVTSTGAKGTADV